MSKNDIDWSVYAAKLRDTIQPAYIDPGSLKKPEERLLSELLIELQEERNERKKEDKRSFWLGVLMSLIISSMVTYGPSLVNALIALLQQAG